MFVLWPFPLARNLHVSFFPLYSFLLKYIYSRKYVLRCIQFFATPWTVAHQAPLSMGFSQQEFWSELPFPPPGDLPDPGITLQSLASPVLAGWFFFFLPLAPPGKPRNYGQEKLFFYKNTETTEIPLIRENIHYLVS